MAESRWTRVWAAVALATTVTLAACGGGDDQPTAQEQFEDAFGDLEDAGEQPTDVETEAKEPELTPLELDLPRDTTYLHATWSVDEVWYRSAGVDELGLELAPAAVVGFTVANTGPAATELAVSPELLWLLDGDGFAIPADVGIDSGGATGSGGGGSSGGRGGGAIGDTVAAGGRSSFEGVFTLEPGIEADDLESYTFRVGADGVVPALVPLSGEMPAPDYPLTLTMPASVDGKVLATGGGAATMRSIEGTATLDFGGERAAEGFRFVTVSAAIDIHDGRGAYINPDDLSMSIDGIVVEQVDAEVPSPTTDLPGGSTTSASWTFTVPADGTSGVLDFGSYSEPGAKGGDFTLPELP